MLSSRRLLKRLDEEVNSCRTDERNVTAEMKHFMLAETKKKPWNVATMANALLRFLEDKYDTKKWVVIVLSEDSRIGKQIRFPLERGDKFPSEFHLANTSDGFVAAAISVDRNGSREFDHWFQIRLNDFKEINCTNDYHSFYDPNGVLSDDRTLQEYLDEISNRLSGMNKQGIETLTIVKHVASPHQTVATSNHTWALFAKNGICSDEHKQVIVLAVNKTNAYHSSTGSSKLAATILPHDKLSKKEIENKMRRTLADTTARYKDRVGVADALLHFLEDEHNNTRKWIVIVISDGDAKTVDHFQSGGVYTASAGGLFAAAVSIKRSDENPQVWEMFKDRLGNFELPIETIIVDNKTHSQNEGAFSLKRKDGAYVIHQMLNNYLFPPLSTCANVTIESMVITTPCTGTRRRIFDYTTIVGTSDLKWLPMTEQDECAQMLVVSLPIRAGLVMPFGGPQYYHSHFSSNKSSNVSERIGLLRNEYGQVYLSVERNSNKDNTRIGADGRWIDSKSQKWQFVNNTLRNGHGKCLVAKNKTSQVLYQQSCLAGSFPGQTWIRHGLQIVNGFSLCLALKNKEKSSVSDNYVVIQDLCDTTPPFLWYNWDVDLEDKIIVHPTGNGSRALRNDFSRRYLSVSLVGKVRHEQWSNQPGQNWQVVNKQLRNGLGINCLTNNSTFLIRQEQCASGEQKAKIWTLNANGQIVCAHNKCLSVGDKNGFVTCVSCNNNSKQYWHHENPNLKTSKIYTN